MGDKDRYGFRKKKKHQRTANFFLIFFFGTTCKKIGKSRVHTWATTPCQATVGSTFTTCSFVLTSCFPQGRKWISLLGFNSYIVKVNAHSRIFLNVLKTCKHCVHVCARSVEAERSTQEHEFLSGFFCDNNLINSESYQMHHYINKACLGG